MDFLNKKDWEKLYNFLLVVGSKNSLDNYIDSVIKEMDKIIPYYAANFFTYSDKNIASNKLKYINISNKTIWEYENYYHALDDIKEKTFNQKHSIKSTDIMDYKKWENTEFFNDFLNYNNLYYSCGVDIHYQDKLLGTIGLFRESTDPDFVLKDLYILNILKDQMANQMYKLKTIEKLKLQQKEDNINLKLEISEKAYELTNREIEIIDHLLTGKNNKQLADDLYISINTVKKHLHNIFKKTEVNNRTELISLIYQK